MRGATLILVLLTLLWAVDAAMGWGVFWAHDLRHHHIPWRVWASAEWAAGRVPLWSEAVGNGFALGADAQTGVFYAPTMLLFGFFKPAVAVNISILGHVLLAAEGMRRLMNRLGHGGPGALLAAVAFAFSGFMATHTGYLGMQNAVAWLPLVVLGAVSGSWARVGLFGALMMVAGHPQIAAIGLLAAAAVAIWRGQLRMFCVGALLALVAASPQLLATLELIEGSMRAGGVDSGFARIGALPVMELLNGVLPEFFGYDRPADMAQSYFHRGDGYWGGGASHWESAFYLGIPVVVLATIGAAGQRFWTGMAVVSVLLMVGSPLWSGLRLLPVFDTMRFPVRFSVVLTLATAVLAGRGLNRALSHPQLDRVAGRLGVACGVFALGLAAAGVVFSRSREALGGSLMARYTARAESTGGVLSGTESLDTADIQQRVDHILSGAALALDPGSASNLWAMGVLVGVGGLFWLRAQGRLRAVSLGIALIALTYVDLWHFGSDYNPRTPAAVLSQPPAAVARLGTALSVGRVGVVDRRRHPSLDHELLSSNIGLQYGLQDVLVPSPLLNTRNEALLERVGLDIGERGAHKWDRVINNLPLVSMLGVRWLISEHPSPSNVFTQHMAIPVSVYENPLAMPREFMVGCVRVTDDEWAELDRFDPRTTAISEADLGLPDCSTPLQGASLEVLEETPTERTFRVVTETPALFVQIESHAPGWVASIDEQAAPIHRINWNFRGVVVGPGTHTLSLRYAPAWLSAALPFSALAWLGLLAAVVRRQDDMYRVLEE